MTPKSGLQIHHIKNQLPGKSKVNASQRMITEATGSSWMGQKDAAGAEFQPNAKGKTH